MQSAARRSDGPLLPAAQRAELLRGVFIVLEPAACNTKRRHCGEWCPNGSPLVNARCGGGVLAASCLQEASFKLARRELKPKFVAKLLCSVRSPG